MQVLALAIENITPEYLANIHPGTHLREDYLRQMGITEYRLAKLLGITQSHLADILANKRGITANIAMRLGKLFDQSPEMWLALQNKYDLAKSARDFGDEVERIQPFEWAAERPEAEKVAA
jgi:addiction module HigA family antidote